MAKRWIGPLGIEDGTQVLDGFEQGVIRNGEQTRN